MTGNRSFSTRAVVLVHVVALAMGLLAGSPAAAKGPVDLVSIERPGGWQISMPGQEWPHLNPWEGGFLGDHLDEAPRLYLWYNVDLLQLDEEGEQRIYTFDYYPDPDEDGGYIYLPKRDDPFEGAEEYRINSGTIIRETGWYRAAGTFASLVDDLQAGYEARVRADAGLAATQMTPPSTGDGGLVR